MTKAEAITILGQACMSVTTNWEGHMKLQEALKVVSEDINIVKQVEPKAE